MKCGALPNVITQTKTLTLTMLATGGEGRRMRRGKKDHKIQVGSSHSVHMKAGSCRGGGGGGGCSSTDQARTSGGRHSGYEWIPSPSSVTHSDLGPNDQPNRTSTPVVPPMREDISHRTPARIRYRQDDELWCNEPELPSLRKPTSTFAQNRMDELLGILRSDVRSLKSQGKCIAKQIWLLYVTFEDFLQVRHPNHLKKLLFRDSPLKREEGTCSDSSPLPSSSVVDRSSETSLVETQPTHVDSCEQSHPAVTRQCEDNSIGTPSAYIQTLTQGTDDICDCCKDDLCQDCTGDFCFAENFCPYCELEDLNESAKGNVRISESDTDVSNSNIPTEDICDCCVQHSRSASPEVTPSMPRPRYASPGATSSGYDTDQDYLTWNETRMSNSKSVMAHMTSGGKPKQVKQFKCKNGRIHNVTGDEFVIKADALYHQNYASSTGQEYPVSRRVIHGLTLKENKRILSPVDGHNSKQDNGKRVHAKNCRRSATEPSRLTHVKKTMKNIIHDLEYDQQYSSNEQASDASDDPKRSFSTPRTEVQGLRTKVERPRTDSPSFPSKMETRTPSSDELVQQNLHRDYPINSQGIVTAINQREEIFQWQDHFQHGLDRATVSHDFPGLETKGLEEVNVTTDLTLGNMGPDSLLDSMTHLHSPATSDLDYRTVEESPDGLLSPPYQPCSTGSISSDSGMASFATGEYSTEYDVYSWGSPIQSGPVKPAISDSTCDPSVPPEPEENIYETIPDELVNTDDDNGELRSAFTPYKRDVTPYRRDMTPYKRDLRRSSICSDTTSHTYASIDINSVSSDYESPKPPALPARNYRRMPPITPLARNHPQVKPRSPANFSVKKQSLHLDDIVKGSDIVDMSGPHMYTVQDVLASFERLAGELPEEETQVQPHQPEPRESSPWGRSSPVYPPRDKNASSQPEQAKHAGNQLHGSFGTGRGLNSSPRYFEQHSNGSFCDNGEGEARQRGSYNGDHYTYLDTAGDQLTTPVKYRHTDFHTPPKAGSSQFSPEHKYLTPHSCSTVSSHVTPKVEPRTIHNHSNNANLHRSNDWQCSNEGSVSIFELRGTYC